MPVHCRANMPGYAVQDVTNAEFPGFLDLYHQVFLTVVYSSVVVYIHEFDTRMWHFRRYCLMSKIEADETFGRLAYDSCNENGSMQEIHIRQ